MRFQLGGLVLGSLTAIVCALGIGQSALAPVLGHGASMRSKVAEAEKKAALSPGDPWAVAPLIDAYLEAHETGAALAVLGRTPETVLNAPALAPVASLAYLEAGDVPRALAVARAALERCTEGGCDRRDEVRLRYQIILADALLEGGISDPLADPVGTEGVKRKAFRRAGFVTTAD
ncbi:MAG: hypothetical protein MUF34_09875 [Polyangiaceae bacterium]|jgi:hypothetical protein|nr:hypothetical protein [Polyangiaceae bacterium]